jgi:hypothetical protein
MPSRSTTRKILSLLRSVARIPSTGSASRMGESEIDDRPAFSPVNGIAPSLKAARMASGPLWSSFSFHAGLFHPDSMPGISRRFRSAPGPTRTPVSVRSQPVSESS